MNPDVVSKLLKKSKEKSSVLQDKLQEHIKKISTVATSSTSFPIPNRFIYGIVVSVVVAILLYVMKFSIVMTSTTNKDTHFREITICPYKIGAYSVVAGVLTFALVSAIN